MEYEAELAIWNSKIKTIKAQGSDSQRVNKELKKKHMNYKCPLKVTQKKKENLL